MKYTKNSNEFLGRSLGMTAWLIRRYAQNLLDQAGLSLDFNHAVVILRIKQSGEVQQQEIAACLVRDKTSTTRWLEDMERRGLIRRKIDSTDRRHKLCTLTAKGERLVDPIGDALEAAHRQALKGISKHDRAQVAGVLSLIRENLTEVLDLTGPCDLWK